MRVLQAADQLVLGDLQAEQLGRYGVVLEGRLHLGGERARLELARGDVDRHAHRVAGARPLPELGERGVSTQRPIGTMRPLSSAAATASATDQPGRSAPSKRSSVSIAVDRAGAQVDDRLVRHEQPVVGERPAQPRRAVEAAQDAGVHLRLVDRDPVASAGLGAVEGEIGVAQRALGVVARPSGAPGRCSPTRRPRGRPTRYGRDSDARSRSATSSGDLVAAVGEQGDELVAAEAGHDVALAHVRREPRRRPRPGGRRRRRGRTSR